MQFVMCLAMTNVLWIFFFVDFAGNVMQKMRGIFFVILEFLIVLNKGNGYAF